MTSGIKRVTCYIKCYKATIFVTVNNICNAVFYIKKTSRFVLSKTLQVSNIDECGLTPSRLQRLQSLEWLKVTNNKFFPLIALLVSCTLSMSSFSANAQGVLLLTSSEITGDFQSTVDATIIKSLKESGQALDYFREDLSMVTDLEMFEQHDWVSFINSKYAGAQIVRVVGLGPFGRSLIKQYHTELLPNAIKFEVAGSKVVKYEVGQPAKVLSESERTSATLNLIGTLLPDMKKVVLISGDPATPALIKTLLESSPNTPQIELWGADMSYADILKDSSTLGSGDVILFSGMLADKNGDRRGPESFMEALYEVANRPIFTTWDSPLGFGALGGAVVEPKKVGLTVAALLLDNFAEQSDLLTIKLDQLVFTRWGLDASKLRSDVDFFNTPTPFWSDIDRVIQYAFFALLALVLFVLFQAVRGRILSTRATIAEHTAEQLRREKAKSQTLFGVVAHELRTPVSAIAMMTSDSEKLDDSQRDLIYQTSQDLLSTIDDMSLMINPNRTRPVRLSSSTIDAFNRTIQKRVDSIVSSSGFRFHQKHNLSSSYMQSDLTTDFYRVRVAISNLIRNACLHSHGTDVVLLNLSGVDARTGEPYLEWEVQDNGTGIEVDEIDRLFRPEERGNTQAPGSGLGLYITKNLIEEIKGTVIYERAQDGGSRFIVRVPIIINPPEQASSEAKAPSTSFALDKLRVLLVEDEATLRLLGKALIGKVVASVDDAVDGQDALNKFDTTFDVVFTDYFMPRINGVELTKSLRKQGYEGLIIGVTAATIGEQIDQLWQSGCDDVIDKPLTLAKITTTLNKLVVSRTQCNL